MGATPVDESLLQRCVMEVLQDIDRLCDRIVDEIVENELTLWWYILFILLFFLFWCFW